MRETDQKRVYCLRFGLLRYLRAHGYGEEGKVHCDLVFAEVTEAAVCHIELHLSGDTAKARRQNRETYNRAREIQADRIHNPPNLTSKEEVKVGKNNKSGETVTWLD